MKFFYCCSIFLLLAIGNAFQLKRIQKSFVLTSSIKSNSHDSSDVLVAAKQLNKQLASCLLQGFVLMFTLSNTLLPIQIASAGEPLPSLEKCFSAVRKELSPEGESINRLSDDIRLQKWDDLKLFTREYDAGFRGFVMKSTWKQIDDVELKKKGIEISNSFTFDLIALNKASRVKDTEDAYKRLEDVKKDLRDFLNLETQVSKIN